MDEFKIKTTKKIVVVKLDIIIATHRDAQPFWDEFEGKLLFRREKIIIDLSECNYIDSTFIGMIIKIFRKVKEEKGELKLVFPQMVSETQFWALGITKVIPCFNSLEEAVKSFQQEIPLREINYNGTINLHLSLNEA